MLSSTTSTRKPVSPGALDATVFIVALEAGDAQFETMTARADRVEAHCTAGSVAASPLQTNLQYSGDLFELTPLDVEIVGLARAIRKATRR